MKQLALLLTFSFCFSTRVMGVGATIQMEPTRGTFGEPFVVDLVVDGGGAAFNAAEADVQLSQNIDIQNLVLGNCGFSFVKTPSSDNPSFAGVLLGKSTKKCTVYSLTLTPTSVGRGQVTFSAASVRRFGDAVDILSTTKEASYELSAALPKPTKNQLTKSASGLSSIELKFFDENNNPVVNQHVNLINIADDQASQKLTNNEGIVSYSDIQQGVYKVSVNDFEGENIINVSEDDSNLTMSIKTKRQVSSKDISLSPLKYYMLYVALGGLVVGAIIFLWTILQHRKQPK